MRDGPFADFHTLANKSAKLMLHAMIDADDMLDWEHVEPLFQAFSEELIRRNKNYKMVDCDSTVEELAELAIYRHFDIGDDYIDLPPLPLSEILTEGGGRHEIASRIELAEESIRRAKAKLNAPPQA